MAIIAGRVIFDRDRSATVSSGDTGIPNVSVVLQNIANNQRLAVFTDANGNYSFENVTNGEYRLVESYGINSAVASPGNFELAIVGEVPVGIDPPIGLAVNPQPEANKLDSLTPNSINITVLDENIVDQNFLDAPIIDIPIQSILDGCATILEDNLIKAADNGSFGTFEASTFANTGVQIEPYPGVTPDYTYVLPNPDVYAPMGGQYTVQNIMNNALSQRIGAWWRVADHTKGDETGRMMVVNGFNPGSIFFTNTVSVKANTNYLFSSWILNLFRANGYPEPQLGVTILGENGEILYNASLGETIPVNTNLPEWREIGTVVNSKNNQIITVQFSSLGPEEIGNDYVIDDISLREIEVPDLNIIKTVNNSIINVGDFVTYTVSLKNNCTSPITNLFFKDVVPNGLEFIQNSVYINGIQMLEAEPNIGFNLPDIEGGETLNLSFDSIAKFVPQINPTVNIGTLVYSYSPVEGGIENEYSVDTNAVLVEIIGNSQDTDIQIIKEANVENVKNGDTIIYTITVKNNGPIDAENVIITDYLPSAISNIEFSIDNGQNWNIWNNVYEIGTLSNGEEVILSIRGIVGCTKCRCITNIAKVDSSTLDFNTNNNIAFFRVKVNSFFDNCIYFYR